MIPSVSLVKISSPENVHLCPYVVLLDWNILRVIVGLVNCLLEWYLLERDDPGPTDQFIASIC